MASQPRNAAPGLLAPTGDSETGRDRAASVQGTVAGGQRGAHRVLIATTTPALGAGLRAWLEECGSALEVVGVVDSRASLEAKLTREVSLLIASACLDGELVAAMAARMAKRVPLLVLVSDPDSQTEADFLRVGATAVLDTRTSRDELLSVATSLIAGRSVASAAAMRLLAEGVEPAPKFTDRQHAILCALAQGRSTKEIASELVLTPSTVKTHIGRLATRLGLSGRQELEAAAPDLLGRPSGAVLRIGDAPGPAHGGA